MELGAFSVSLSVKDLTVSKHFYETLGFQQIAGQAAEGWVILKNGESILGLFQGMFTGNMLTFNPGWRSAGEPLEEFTDIRQIQAHLRANGLDVETPANEGGTGPASMVLVDPDGNRILFDQHVPAPKGA